MAVTLRLGQTAHLYLSIYVTYSRPINLPAKSPKKVGGVGVGGGEYASTRCHYVVVYGFGWGMGSSWLRLHSAGCAFGLGGIFMRAPARGCNPVWPRPTGPALPCSGPHLASEGSQRLPDRHPPLQAPPANSSHSAGYQPPSLRINYHTGLVSLMLDTFYTTLIPNINSFFLLF